MKILFEDDHLLVVDKPAGLLVHKSWLDSHATEFAQDMAEAHCGHKLHTLHRLDRPTSGVLMFGKSPEVARSILSQFENRTVGKTYLAIARGWTRSEGLIDEPLVEELDKIADRHSFGKERQAQAAQTHFMKLAHTELDIPVSRYPKARYSLVLAEPLTGRKHQIRRHFRKISHHLVSDTRHGDGRHNELFIRHFDWRQLALRALELRLEHPVTGLPLQINASLTAEWERIIGELGWKRLVPVLSQPLPEWLYNLKSL